MAHRPHYNPQQIDDYVQFMARVNRPAPTDPEDAPNAVPTAHPGAQNTQQATPVAPHPKKSPKTPQNASLIHPLVTPMTHPTAPTEQRITDLEAYLALLEGRIETLDKLAAQQYARAIASPIREKISDVLVFCALAAVFVALLFFR